jgi:hypothetical protein
MFLSISVLGCEVASIKATGMPSPDQPETAHQRAPSI